MEKSSAKEKSSKEETKVSEFFPTVTKESILAVEFINPFKQIKLFPLYAFDWKKPLTLDQVPAQYRPYSGCLFVRKHRSYICTCILFYTLL